MAGRLDIERRDGVAIATLNRPEKRNALSIDLRVEIGEAFTSLGSDDEVGCVVLTGAGPAFCSGMDTTQFGGDAENKRRLVETSTLAFDAVGNCPQARRRRGQRARRRGRVRARPSLRPARSPGPAARFGYPELPRGIPPSYAAARAALPATVARDLCLTGRSVDAAEALALGIVRERSDGDPVERAIELAAEIAAMPRQAVLATKSRILLERRETWGYLFEEERRAFAQALLGDGG